MTGKVLLYVFQQVFISLTMSVICYRCGYCLIQYSCQLFLCMMFYEQCGDEKISPENDIRYALIFAAKMHHNTL